jgi:uncharacterized SAM-binding protein YcdF (DUF218 family)
MRTRWALRLVGGVLLALFAALAFTPLADVMHGAIVDPPPPLEPARAIVVLGAGMIGHELSDASLRRALHGVVLFREGRSPLLVMLGGPGDGPTTEANVRVRLAREMGVPPEALVADMRGRTTREESTVSWEVLAPRGAQKILLVTGREHMPRAAALFRQAGFEVVPAPVEELPAGADRPQGRLELARGLLRELVARAYNRAAGYL